MHGISDQDWEDYLDNSLSTGERERIEKHLTACPTCRELYERIRSTTRLLQKAGAKARHDLSLRDEQLYQGLLGLFTRVRAEKADRTTSTFSPIHKRLDELESVLAEMCGSHTAVRALEAAAKSSPARSLEQMTVESWQPFLDNLTSIAAVVCGEFGAQLVLETGQI